MKKQTHSFTIYKGRHFAYVDDFINNRKYCNNKIKHAFGL